MKRMSICSIHVWIFKEKHTHAKVSSFNLCSNVESGRFPTVSRCREVEQDVTTLKAQLVEKQAVQSENDRLKLQLDSMQAQSQLEQRKAGEERSDTPTHIY